MTIEKTIRLVAGSLVVAGVTMASPACPLYVSHHLLWLPAFVGFMLAQSAITGICPMAIVLEKLGMRSAGG